MQDVRDRSCTVRPSNGSGQATLLSLADAASDEQLAGNAAAAAAAAVPNGSAAAAAAAVRSGGAAACAPASPPLAAETSGSSRGSRRVLQLRSATMADSSDLDDDDTSCSSRSSSPSGGAAREQQHAGAGGAAAGPGAAAATGAAAAAAGLAGLTLQQQQQQQQAGPGPPPPPAAAAHADQLQQQPQPQIEQQIDRQQQQQQQQQDATARIHSTGQPGLRTVSADPDYEVPVGKLTETQVVLASAQALHLDRYGFILPHGQAGTAGGGGSTAGGSGSRGGRGSHTGQPAAAQSPAAAAPGAAQQQQAPPPPRGRSASEARRERRRLAKWRCMLGSGAADWAAFCASQPRVVKRRVRKGIPDELRGLVWQYLSGGRALLVSQPGEYARLLRCGSASEAVESEIMRDLNRTFPNHVFFAQRQGPGQTSLFHVLRAYSAFDGLVGYVQGMGFVAAVLLMYMAEEEAFWTLVALLQGSVLSPPLAGLYHAGMPLLQQCLFQFQELLKAEHARLGGHMEREGVVPSMYCTHWFNTIFAYSLPFEHLLRVWDVFIMEGMKVVFRVGLVLLASAQEQLLGMPFEKLVAALNARRFPVLERHPDALMRAALRIPVSRRLELLRQRYEHMQAQQASQQGGSVSPQPLVPEPTGCHASR